MKKHIFIINPTAGKHKGPELISHIKSNFSKVTILETQYPGHASELAKDYAGPDTIIYSVGGDGTLNEVINGIMASDYSNEVTFANVPCGSGNDFIKGFTSEKNPYKLLDSYLVAKTKAIDVGLINGRSFINISSMGFDAEIVLGAKKYKQLPFISAELAYIISVFATLIKLRGYNVTVQIDDHQAKNMDVLFITMANGNYYGGGMNAAPKAIHDDGLFDFCIVDQIKRRQVPFLLPKFMKGKHEGLKVLTALRGRNMTIKSNQAIPLNIDGEVLLSDSISISIKEKAINLLLP